MSDKNDKAVPKAPAVPPPVPLLVVEWGSRSRAQQPRIAKLRAGRNPPDPPPSGDNFMLLSPGNVPVNAGWVAAKDLPTWDTATATPLTMKPRGKDPTQVSFEFLPPTNPANLRLDFDLKVTAGGQTASVLTFRQLFKADDKGLLSGDRVAIETLALTATSTTVTGATGARRIFTGQHPLITFSQLKVSINAEFVDLTVLWWLLRKDKVGWYLNPALGGRPTHLRVLGWTTNAFPMIWFACIPDAAESSITATPPPPKPGQPPPPPPVGGDADLVFMRPQAGINTFVYATTAAGLADSRHDETTMWLLARYLLSPIPASSLAGVKSGGSVSSVTLASVINPSTSKPMQLSINQLADQLQPTGGTPPGAPTPTDPMTLASRLPDAFRPVGLEPAFNRVAGSRVMFIPLGVDTNSAYEACLLKVDSSDTPAALSTGLAQGLKTMIRNALAVLWTSNAIDRTGIAIPNLNNRELWIGGHSGANISMFSCATQNRPDIARIITFDASPRSLLVGTGIPAIANVKVARGTKSFEVFVIVSPNLSRVIGKPFQGMDDPIDTALRGTKASITELPDFPERISYWTPSPVSTPKTFVQYVLSNWSDALIDTSAKTPSNWPFLFFHELAVYGGHLVPPAPPPVTSPPTPPSSPRIRTFFEDALGAPNPRPALPAKKKGP